MCGAFFVHGWGLVPPLLFACGPSPLLSHRAARGAARVCSRQAGPVRLRTGGRRRELCVRPVTACMFVGLGWPDLLRSWHWPAPRRGFTPRLPAFCGAVSLRRPMWHLLAWNLGTRHRPSVQCCAPRAYGPMMLPSKNKGPHNAGLCDRSQVKLTGRPQRRRRRASNAVTARRPHRGMALELAAHEA